MWAVHGSESLTPALPVNALKSPHLLSTLCMCVCVCLCAYVCLFECVRKCVCVCVSVEVWTPSSCWMQHTYLLGFFLKQGIALSIHPAYTLVTWPVAWKLTSSTNGYARNQWEMQAQKWHREHLTIALNFHFTTYEPQANSKFGKKPKSPRIPNVWLRASAGRRAASHHDAHNLELQQLTMLLLPNKCATAI